MKASILLAIGAVAIFIVAIFGSVAASGLGGANLPSGMWIAYGFGAVLTIVFGSGLFALTFFSARNGYDDIDQHEDGPAN